MWKLTKTEAESFKQDFTCLSKTNGKISEKTFKTDFSKFGLPAGELQKIWKLSDLDRDSFLTVQEYILARILVRYTDYNGVVPNSVPKEVIDLFIEKQEPSKNKLKSENDTSSIRILPTIDKPRFIDSERKTAPEMSPLVSSKLLHFASKDTAKASLQNIIYKKPQSVFSNLNVDYIGNETAGKHSQNDFVTLRRSPNIPDHISSSSYEDLSSKSFDNSRKEKEVFNPMSPQDVIPMSDKAEYINLYVSKTTKKTPDESLDNTVLKSLLMSTHVDNSILKRTWDLSDIDKDGLLSCSEFCLAMHLCKLYKNTGQLPGKVSSMLIESAAIDFSQNTRLTPTPQVTISSPRCNTTLDRNTSSFTSNLSSSSVGLSKTLTYSPENRFSFSSPQNLISKSKTKADSSQNMRDLKSFFEGKEKTTQASENTMESKLLEQAMHSRKQNEKDILVVKQLFMEYKEKLLSTDSSLLDDELKMSLSEIPDEFLCVASENIEIIELVTKFMKLGISAITKINEERIATEFIQKELTQYHIKLNELLRSQSQLFSREIPVIQDQNKITGSRSNETSASRRLKRSDQRLECRIKSAQEDLEILHKGVISGTSSSTHSETNSKKKKDLDEIVEHSSSTTLSKIAISSKNTSANVDYKIPVKTTCVAIVAHKAISKGELSLQIGDVLTVHLTKPLEHEIHLLMAIKENGERGIVPTKYIDYYNADAAPVASNESDYTNRLSLSSEWETADLKQNTLNSPLVCKVQGHFSGANGHIFKPGDVYTALKKTRTNHLVYSNELLPKNNAQWIPSIFLDIPFSKNLDTEFVNLSNNCFKECSFGLCITDVLINDGNTIIKRGDIGLIKQKRGDINFYFNGKFLSLESNIVKKINLGDYPINSNPAFVLKNQKTKCEYELKLCRGQKLKIFILNSGGWSFGYLEETDEWGWFDSECAPVCTRPNSSNTKKRVSKNICKSENNLNFYGICIDHYYPQSDKDIACKMWDVVRVLEIPSDWWLVSINGKVGVIPYHYIDMSLEMGGIISVEEPQPKKNPDASDVSEKERKRICTINEVISTERIYLKDLFYAYDIFYCNLLIDQVISKYEADALFLNWKKIIACSYRFCSDLNKRTFESNSNYKFIGDLLLKNFHTFQPYIVYFEGHSDSLKRYTDIKQTNPDFNNAEKKLISKLPASMMLPLSTFFIKPLQRLTKYPLLLRELLKYTNDSAEDYKNLLEAEEKIKEICAYANECVRRAESLAVLSWLQSRFSLTVESRSLVFNSYTNLSTPRQLLIHGIVNCIKSKKSIRIFIFTDFVAMAKVSSSVPKTLPFEGFPNCFSLYKSIIFVGNLEYMISNVSDIEFMIQDKSTGVKHSLEALDYKERDNYFTLLEETVQTFKISYKKSRVGDINRYKDSNLRRFIMCFTLINDFPFDKIKHKMFYFKVTCGKQVTFSNTLELSQEKNMFDVKLDTYIEKNYTGSVRINLFCSFNFFPDDYVDHIEISAQSLTELRENEKIMEKLNFVRNPGASLNIRILS